MSKYHDDSTYATNPGAMHMSLRKLRDLEPKALDDKATFLCGTTCGAQHPAAQMRERWDEHMELGASEAAMVVSINPLLIAATAGDLDAAILLRYPQALAQQYDLRVGMRLLTVNTYGDNKDRTGQPLFAADVVPGPRRELWTNAQPFIAEFLCDDMERIDTRKREIPEEDWIHLEELARVRVERLGTQTARDGRPSLAGIPVKIQGKQFVPLEGPAPRPTVSGKWLADPSAATPPSALRKYRMGIVLAAVLVIAWLAVGR